MTPSAFRYSVWLPLMRQSGVRYRKPHTLRHTFASMLIQAGESLVYVKEQLVRAPGCTRMATLNH